MIKLVFKLAIAGLLGNAAYRVGTEYLAYIKFRDAVRDAAMFKAATDEQLHQQIMDLASQYDVPLEESALSISRQARQVHVDGGYTKPIELAPTFVYEWPFSWSTDVTVSTVAPSYRTVPTSR
jgi:hypothetical protein